MKIANYSMTMASVRELEISYTKNESLQQWQDAKPGSGGESPPGVSIQDYLKKALKDKLEISEQAQEALKQQQSQSARNVNPYDGFQISDADNQKIILLEKLLSALTGREIKLHIPRIKNTQTSDNPQWTGVNLQKHSNPEAQAAPPRQGWGMVYQKQGC